MRLGYGQGQESELLSHCLVCGGSPRGTSGDDSGGSGWTTAGPVLRLGYGQGQESELLSHCLVCGGSPRGTSGDDSGGSGWTTAGSVLRLGYCIAARVRCRTLLE